MILVATILAVAVFFMSIPEKHSQNSLDQHAAVASSPDLGPEETPGSGLQNTSGSPSRDPFLPPAIAWSNIETSSPHPEIAQEPIPKVTVPGGKPTHVNIIKPKATPVKNPVKSPVKSSQVHKTTPVPTDQTEPNDPEYKENLILPGLNQNDTKNGKDQNTGTGLKVQYIVKKGETISRIAQKFGVSRESIIRENRLSAGTDKIPEGKVLVIPIPKTHLYQLKADETLWRVAVRYETTVELLQEINNIQDLNKLKSGQIIILPVPVGKN
jgi:LysM repeat protein